MGAAAALAAPALLGALSDEKGVVRDEAAECLFRIGAPAVPLLAGALVSDRPEVRYLAAGTLGRIGLGASAALPDLRVVADSDADADVREAATVAISVIDPQGVRGWLWKLGFEIGDEPWGIPYVLIGFVALTTLASVRPLLRSWRLMRADPATAGAATEADAPEAGDADEDEDAPDEEDGPADDRLSPPQGIPHAIAGLVAMAVGVLAAFLITIKGDADPDERHGIYHFAGLFILFGYLFVKIGLKGAWIERRARALDHDQRAVAARPGLGPRRQRTDQGRAGAAEPARTGALGGVLDALSHRVAAAVLVVGGVDRARDPRRDRGCDSGRDGASHLAAPPGRALVPALARRAGQAQRHLQRSLRDRAQPRRWCSPCGDPALPARPLREPRHRRRARGRRRGDLRRQEGVPAARPPRGRLVGAAHVRGAGEGAWHELVRVASGALGGDGRSADGRARFPHDVPGPDLQVTGPFSLCR